MTKRILVIDDHAETLRLTTLILKRRDYDVLTAQSGKEGIEIAKEFIPDMVLLDVMMPDMNGIEVCRAFRADPLLQSVPIMMFTARTQIEDQNEAIEAGANEYVTKPTRPKELLGRVESALETHLGGIELPDEIEVQEIVVNQRIVAVLGSTKAVGCKFVALNLSAELAQHQPVTLLRLTPSSVDSVEAVTLIDISEDQDKLLPAIADSSAESIIVIEAGDSAENIPSALHQQLSDVIVCFSPDLTSISQAQTIIKALGSELSDSAEIHAIMLDFSGSVSVPLETASNFLKHPVLAAIAIDTAQFDESRSGNKMLVQAYPEAQASQQIKTVAQKLTAPVEVR